MKRSTINFAMAAALRWAARPVACLGLLLGVAGTAAGQQSPAVSVTSIDAESIRVRIDNVTQQPGRVQVVDMSTGQTLFRETYSAPAYGHRFSFRGLPLGRYALLLSVAGTQYNYTLQVLKSPAGPALTVRAIKARGPQLLAAAR